ncbi:MAG: TPM domain-containing protein [Terriglobia bacterium]
MIRAIGITKLCLLGLAFLCLTGLASGQRHSLPKPDHYVSDFARVIDANSSERLESLCQELESKTGAQLAIVTIGSLNGEQVEDFAVKLFQDWGIGKKDKSEGLLLLIAVQDRKSRIEVGYGLEPVITDGISGEILRSLRPYFRANQYGEGLYFGASSLASRVAESKGIQLSAKPPSRGQRMPAQHDSPSMTDLLVPLIFLGIFFLLPLLLSARKRQIYQTPPGRYYRRGGFPGGFGDFGGMGGGGGSSGGFGGFGGGQSGGGGASSDW